MSLLPREPGHLVYDFGVPVTWKRLEEPWEIRVGAARAADHLTAATGSKFLQWGMGIFFCPW